MPRELTYTVEVREHGMPWRVMWRGPGEAIAAASAAELAAKQTQWRGADIWVPTHPCVRVRQGRRVVVSYVEGRVVA